MVWPIVHSDMGLPKFAGLNAYHCFLYRKTMKHHETTWRTPEGLSNKICSNMFWNKETISGYPCSTPESPPDRKKRKRKEGLPRSSRTNRVRPVPLSAPRCNCTLATLKTTKGRGTAGRPIFKYGIYTNNTKDINKILWTINKHMLRRNIKMPYHMLSNQPKWSLREICLESTAKTWNMRN